MQAINTDQIKGIQKTGVILIPILFSSGKQYLADSEAVQLVCLALMYRSKEANTTNKGLFHRYIHTYRLQHTPWQKFSSFQKKIFEKVHRINFYEKKWRNKSLLLFDIQATSVVEITKNRNHNHNYEGIQLENESWSILIKKLAFILELENVRRK